MLLNPKLPVERRCPAWWSVGAASCFLAGAVFVSGVGLRAEAAPLGDDEDGKPARIETKDVEVIVKGDKIYKDKVKVLRLKDVKENKVKILQDGEEKELAVICVDCENCCQDELKAKIAKAGGTDKVIVVEVGKDGEPRFVTKTPFLGKILKADPKLTQAEVILREGTNLDGQLKVQAKSVDGQEVLWVAAVHEDEDDSKKKKQKAQEAEAKATYQRALRLTDAQTKEIQETLKRAQELAGKAGQQGLEDAKARLEQAAAELAKAKKMMDMEVQKAKEQAEKSSQDAKKSDEGSRKAAIEALIQAETKKAKAQGEKATAEGQKAAEAGRKAALEAWTKAQKAGQGAGQELRGYYHGGATGGRLGIMLSSVSDELRAHLDLGKDAGVLVVDVVDDSAAAKAGFQKHDIVVAMNNNAVGSDLQAFIKGVQEIKTGDKVSFVVLRKGKKTAIKEVTMPEAKAAPHVYGIEGLKGVDGKKAPYVIQAVPGKDGKTFEWKMPEGFKFDADSFKKFEELKKLHPEGFKFDADSFKKFEELKKLDPEAAKKLEGMKIEGFKFDGSKLENLKKEPKVNVEKKFEPKVLVEKEVEGKLAEKTKSAKSPTSKSSNVTTTTTIRDNSITSRHQEGSLVITVAGTVKDGKVSGIEIVINDGGKESNYTSVDKVPEQYREKVKNLLNVGEKGKIRIETKSRSDSDV